jgi:hypothetical protein
MPETAPTERGDRTESHGCGDVGPILVWQSTDPLPPIGLSPLAPPRKRRRGRKRGVFFEPQPHLYILSDASVIANQRGDVLGDV